MEAAARKGRLRPNNVNGSTLVEAPNCAAITIGAAPHWFGVYNHMAFLLSYKSFTGFSQSVANQSQLLLHYALPWGDSRLTLNHCVVLPGGCEILGLFVKLWAVALEVHVFLQQRKSLHYAYLPAALHINTMQTVTAP